MKLTRDKKIYLPDGDNFPRWGEGYERKQFFETMRHVPNRHTAVDVGAHVGIWTRRLSELFTEVFAFEPVPEHVECWHANTTQHPNATLEQVALSDKAEVVKMKQTANNSGMSTVEYKQLRADQKEIEISTITLDSFNLARVDFMKIDIEGHEVSMLEGAVDTIAVYAPIIFIEIHDKERKKDINAYDWLVDKGYEEVVPMSTSNYLFAK